MTKLQGQPGARMDSEERVAIAPGDRWVTAGQPFSASRKSVEFSAAAGIIMIGWITGETILIHGCSWVQGLYLLTRALVVALSWCLTTTRTSTSRPLHLHSVRRT